MQYEQQNFENLLGTPGFSDELLTNHFTLYGGYITNANKLIEKLNEMQGTDTMGTPEYNELKRRFGWEWNGMRLHEYYFGNMIKDAVPFAGAETLSQKITTQFGSYEKWEKDFLTSGAMRGIGWVILVHEKATDRLFNIWVDEHDTGILAGTTPLLILDVFEHAYVSDYGLKRMDYMEAFLNAVDWNAVEKRLG